MGAGGRGADMRELVRLPNETFVEWALRLLEEWEHERQGDLPRCVHKNHLRDWSGEWLEPACGCHFPRDWEHNPMPHAHERLIAGDGWESDSERERRTR